MDEQTLTALLRQVRDGGMQIPEAVDRLRRLEVEVLASARLDHHRALRTGLPEAVFGENKSADQLVEILAALLRTDSVVLATRVDADKAAAVRARLAGLAYHPAARILTGNDRHIPVGRASGTVVIVTAGTSDLPVAE